VIAPLSGLAQSLAKGLISVYWGQQVLERLLPDEDLQWLGRGSLAWDRPLMFVVAHAAVLCIAAKIILRTTRGRGRST
jgi:hypothetical protein